MLRTLFSMRALQIELGRQHVAAEFRHAPASAHAASRPDGDRRAFQKRRADGIVTSPDGPANRGGPAAFDCSASRR